MAGNLMKKIIENRNNGPYPLHMPGHKRNEELLGSDLPWGLDVTEMEGFDNLQVPLGVLRKLADEMAALWGSELAFPLVGGSTAGVLAAIYAAVSPGDQVLVACNCHQSVYHGLELMNLRPVFLTPPVVSSAGIFGSIRPEQVASALDDYCDIRLAVITSPTYEGVLSDIGAIGELLHSRNVPLLVDEAHGAHLGLSPGFPKGAVDYGGDLVVQSLHKTLPALNQTAVLHVQGDRIDPKRVRHAVNLFQTTSPSYPLLASMERCLVLLEENGQMLFDGWLARLDAFYTRTARFKRLSVFRSGPEVFDRDPGKLLISTADCGMNGKALSRSLRERFGLEVEMAGAASVLAMTSICDTDEGLDRFSEGLLQIDSELQDFPAVPVHGTLPPPLPEGGVSSREAARSKGCRIPFVNALGRISREYVRVYPPGIPALLPGQQITAEMIDYLRESAALELDVLCGSQEWDGYISVVADGIDRCGKII